MNSPLHFRQAKPADAAGMLAVKRDAILAIDDVYDQSQLEAWAPRVTDFDAFEASPSADQYVVQVALDGGDVIGYGVLEIPNQRLDALFVDPDYQRTHVATTIYRQLETSARFSGIDRLTVVSSVTAVPFYEALGFQRIDTREKAIEGVTLPFVTMAIDLDV